MEYRKAAQEAAAARGETAQTQEVAGETAEAKDALMNRHSSMADEEYAGTNGRLNQIMEDEGFDPTKSGYVQAIFNADTSKRNSAKKAAKADKTVQTTSADKNVEDAQRSFDSAKTADEKSVAEPARVPQKISCGIPASSLRLSSINLFA